MKRFEDNKGRTWTVNVNVDAIKRVKALIGVDLLEVVEGKLLERLTFDPVLLCDVVYAVCKPEAESDGVSDEDFGRGMAGDAIDAATAALLEDLVDFFPTARRGVLAKALAKARTLEAMALKRADEVLDSDRFERAMKAELDRVGMEMEASLQPSGAGGSSGNSPVSPASTQDR